MLVPAPQPNAYWHMDATRGLVKDVDGRPVYVYLVHVSMQDGVHRLCRSGCAPVLAAAYATTDTSAGGADLPVSPEGRHPAGVRQ